jgi:hypothetical protein
MNKILPRLKAMPMRDLMMRTGLSRRALQMIRAGRNPNPKSRVMLARVARGIRREYLKSPPTFDGLRT